MSKNLMTGQVFITFKVPKLKIFGSRSLFSLFYQLLHFFVKNRQLNPYARAKFTSQNLMPRQKLTPEIPSARAHTSVPTFLRESPRKKNDIIQAKNNAMPSLCLNSVISTWHLISKHNEPMTKNVLILGYFEVGCCKICSTQKPFFWE